MADLVQENLFLPSRPNIATIMPMWQRTPLLLALICLSLAQVARPAAQSSGSPTFSVSVDLVKVPLSVFDEKGSLTGDLRKEDFRIWEDQAPQEIRSFGVDTNPISVVLLLDASMSEKPELKKLKNAVEEFASVLAPEDRISLITFNDEVYQNLDWTNDQKKIRRALGKIQIGLRTALYDAMYLAASEQLKGIEGRKAVILLTDCIDNQINTSWKDASLAIIQSQASLYVISKTVMMREDAKREPNVVWLGNIYKNLTGDGNYVDEYFEKLEKAMTELAEKTGGRSFFPTDYSQIKDNYSEIARELRSKYFLTYVSNQNLTPNSYHRIAIEYLKPASKVMYRKGYYYKPEAGSKIPLDVHFSQ
jgi:Ca-activated chloride channel family protein